MNTLGDRLLLLRNTKNLSAKDVMSAISINDLGRFEKNARKPSVDTLMAIANFYNVSIDWLLTGKNPQAGESIFTDEELSLISQYRNLDSIGKRIISERIQVLAEYETAKSNSTIKQNKNSNNNVVPIHKEKKLVCKDVFDQSASAGMGNYLDSYATCESLSFPEDEVPLKADFGIRISGDSMEPDILDGSVVWVEQCIQIENGQIGIFILNGESYCKKLDIDYDKREVYLLSLNEKYKPIKIEEYDELKTVGRVLL